MHKALNPLKIVPEPGRNTFKNRQSNATGTGRNGIAEKIYTIE